MAGLITPIMSAVAGSGAAGAMMIGGTILSTVGAIQAGNAQSAAATYQARQLDAQALSESASAQREADQKRREKDLIMSRARAVGAASGGGLDLEIMGDIEEEGEYRALTALWEGEERAKGRKMQAQAARFEGTQAKRAGYIKGTGTILSGGASFMDKYGG